jgi:hypothetical protein
MDPRIADPDPHQDVMDPQHCHNLCQSPFKIRRDKDDLSFTPLPILFGQDEALKETIFELDDDLGNKTSKRKRGEVLRAKALTERKLAICRSAIEKNSRSIKLGKVGSRLGLPCKNEKSSLGQLSRFESRHLSKIQNGRYIGKGVAKTL